MVIGPVLWRALSPALRAITPILVHHGAAALEGALKSPQRRAWRTYAAAALTGLASDRSLSEDNASELAADIADRMVRLEAERNGEGEDDI